MLRTVPDKDSDAFITTDNPVLLRTYEKLLAIFCVQKSAQKIKVTEKSLIKANKDGFGDDIGTTTNRITEMFDILAKFEEESLEYKELMYRIMCGQHYQQCAIDKIKGIKSNPMPKEWHESRVNKLKVDTDTGEILDSTETIKLKEFNMRIVADKKPYFFIYIYPQLKNSYDKFIKETENKCITQFGITLTELFKKKNKNETEESFIKYYNLKNPVSNNDCVMNKICREIEKEFKSIKNKINKTKFNYTILKTDDKYTKNTYNKIKTIYEEYMIELSQFKMLSKKNRVGKEDKNEGMMMLKQDFKEKCQEECVNEKELCNILVDMCYKSEKSKQFVWDMCGNQIINNLLNKNNFIINYPKLDNINGDIEFGGENFILNTIEVKKGEDE